VVQIESLKSPWIDPVQGTVSTVRVQVQPIAVADGIGLQEPADLGVVVAGAVVVEAGLLVELAAGEQDAVGVVGVGGADPAVNVVLVDLDRVAAAVGQGHDAAEGVEVIVVRAGVGAGRLDQADRLIDAGAVEVFAFEIAAGVVFGETVVAVVDVLEDRGV